MPDTPTSDPADRHCIVLIRHGETAWTLTGQHTSRTDVPLTARGVHQAEVAARRLVGQEFSLVLTSPRRRAVDTCQIAGFGDRAEVTEDVTEWDYGDDEGLTTAQIRSDRPG